MKAIASAKTRRTQSERRETTIAKLVNATIESLRDVGYGATSVKEVCNRAGLSHGGLFRHFASMHELFVAAAEEVARRQIAQFEDRRPTELPAAIRALRDACRSPMNTVWYELLNAARTDENLRRALQPAAELFYQAIRATAARLPGVDALPKDLFDTLIFTLVHVFDGESIARVVLPSPEREERRMDLLVGILDMLLAKQA